MRREDKQKLLNGTMSKKRMKDFHPHKLMRVKLKYERVDRWRVKQKLMEEHTKRESIREAIKKEINVEIAKRVKLQKMKDEYISSDKQVKKLKGMIDKSKLQIKKLELHISVCRGAMNSNKVEKRKEFNETHGKFDDGKLKSLREKLYKL